MGPNLNLATLTAVGLALWLASCKPTTQSTAEPKASSLSGKPPITVRTVPDGTEVAFGFSFRSTLNEATYRVTPGDCGYILRSNRTEGSTWTLPLLPFPCALLIFNEKPGLLTVNLEGTAPDGSGGDFNGEKTFTLSEQEGAILHVNQSSAFYRGLFTCRGGYGGCKGSGGGPPAPLPPTSTADLSDFKVTQVSNKKLDIAPGSFAIGSYSFPSQTSGTIEFTAGSGVARVYVSKLGILTTEASVGTTAKLLGGMILITSAQPSFPSGSIPIASLTLSNSTYTLDQSNLASRVRGFAIDPGTGLESRITQGVIQLSADTTLARRDADNIWTGHNDFTNANVTGFATTGSVQTAVYISWTAISLIIFIIAYLIWRDAR
jgi:hypothetical protein